MAIICSDTRQWRCSRWLLVRTIGNNSTPLRFTRLGGGGSSNNNNISPGESLTVDIYNPFAMAVAHDVTATATKTTTATGRAKL